MIVTLEDEMNRELPTSIDLYKTVRQNIYSILLNLNKLKIIHDNQKEKGKLYWAPILHVCIFTSVLGLKAWSRRGNGRVMHKRSFCLFASVLSLFLIW